MRRSSRLSAMLLLQAALLAGCASVEPQAAFNDVREDVADRTGQAVQWSRTSVDDDALLAAVREMLKEELTADRAVQIALLNNRRLQAAYDELGIAQAALAQAARIKNPVIEGSIRYTDDGDVVEIALVQDLLAAVTIAPRRRLAAEELEAVKARTAAAALDLALETRQAFYTLQGAEQTLEMRRTILEAADASYDLAGRLHEAGNITDLALASEQVARGQAKLDLAAAELVVTDARERLGCLMGLWGEDTQWRIAPRLPAIPEQEINVEHVEARAVERSLSLAVARREIAAGAQRLGVTRTTSLFDELGFVVDSEHQTADGGWSIGPGVVISLPVFNQGQAARSTATAELHQRMTLYVAQAVEIRSGARMACARLLYARQRAQYHEQVVVPLRRQITAETQRAYNAMQVGIFELLQAKQQEIAAEAASLDALRAYWIARAGLEHVLNGGMPPQGTPAGGSTVPGTDR